MSSNPTRRALKALIDRMQASAPSSRKAAGEAVAEELTARAKRFAQRIEASGDRLNRGLDQAPRTSEVKGPARPAP